MGCCLGLKDVVTAITFVALGTSLPDAFASKAATINDDSADAAVGNVTGSNAVRCGVYESGWSLLGGSRAVSRTRTRR